MTPEELKALADSVAGLKLSMDTMLAADVARKKAETDAAAAAKKVVDDEATATAKKKADDEAAARSKTNTPAENALMTEQRRQIEELQKKQKESDDRYKAEQLKGQGLEKSGMLGKILDGYQFVAPEARNTALTMLDSMVKRNDDGSYTAADTTPEAFAKTFLTEQNSYLLAPAHAGGSGASGAPGTGGINRGGSVPTTEMIKPGMTAEDRAAITRQILALTRPV